MAVTIQCPDCGHTKPSDDGEPETCPECEGTMASPPKKKYQAKSSSLEDEERAKKKSKSRGDDDRPKQKTKTRTADEDDEGGEAKGGSVRDAKIAERIVVDPGFTNRALMKQVEGELSRGEVLYFACRPSEVIAKKQGLMAVAGGLFFSLVGVVVAVLMLTVGSGKVPPVAVIVPALFVLIGVLIAILGPIMKKRQARMGWYAVTDRRALVFNVAPWGQSGHLEVYQPSDLRKMWIKKSFWVTGVGDLVFKTEVHDNRVRHVDRRTGQTVKTTGSRSEHHYGFLGIEDVKDVETLIHEVLLSGDRDDDDE